MTAGDISLLIWAVVAVILFIYLIYKIGYNDGKVDGRWEEKKEFLMSINNKGAKK